MSASEKPPLELGSTYRRAELNVSAFRACYSYEKQVDWLLAHDAEVINRVRPQIEAEARAAEIEDAIAAIRKRAECTLSDALEVADAVDAISALATTPAGHVCVPVDEPFGWWAEWNGDVSDEGNYIFTVDKEELDTEHIWIPLYARPK